MKLEAREAKTLKFKLNTENAKLSTKNTSYKIEPDRYRMACNHVHNADHTLYKCK